LAFPPGELRRLNANEPAILAAHLTEFNAAIGLINSINTHEREYYEFVPRYFDALRKVGRPWRGRQNRLSRVLNAAPAVPLNPDRPQLAQYHASAAFDGNRNSSGAGGPDGLVMAERDGWAGPTGLGLG
jgi:hypothetical protein